MIDGYKTKYPFIKTKLSDIAIEGLASLKVTHGIDAAGELYEILEREIEIEIMAHGLIATGISPDLALEIASERVLKSL